MSRTYSALEISSTTVIDEDYLDRLIAAIDDASPTAVEPRDDGNVRIFFATATGRAQATELLRAFANLRVLSIDVPDEDWAARSQTGLGPVVVGRVTVSTSGVETHSASPVDPRGRSVHILIPPSMGFGTGHHASTRRCLALLQRVPVEHARVFDAGTGSGVLALAAWRLGARDIVAGDCDPDALESAGGNLERNNASKAITLALVDLGNLSAAEPKVQGPFDLVLANLTGGALIRYAPTLRSLLSSSGRIIASGFQRDEVAAVADAFALTGLTLSERDDEDGWVGAIFAPEHSSHS